MVLSNLRWLPAIVVSGIGFLPRCRGLCALDVHEAPGVVWVARGLVGSLGAGRELVAESLGLGVAGKGLLRVVPLACVRCRGCSLGWCAQSARIGVVALPRL